MPIVVRAVKVTIPISDDQFTWNLVPLAGAPGSKNSFISLELAYGDGTIKMNLKGGTLQKVKAIRDAEPGGFIVIQGKLSAGGGEIAEAGATYQPPKATV